MSKDFNGAHGTDAWKQQTRNDKGQFGESLRGEIDFDPASIDPDESPQHNRLKNLAEGKYVPATAEPARPIAPVNAGGWWDKHSVIAEHRPEGRNAYPRIPGRTPTGRRVVRRQYKGAGVHLQMPSAAAIRRFAADTPGSFDVPVSATINGRTADAWVRVTPTGGGGYRVNALGVGGENGTRLAEAVSCVVEARRPTLALQQVNDLVERAHTRRAENVTGAEQKELASWINSAGYDDSTGVSTIVIKGKPYGYKIPKQVHEQVYTSTAPGTLFNLMVKPDERRTAVAVHQCGACRRVHVASQQHDCQPFTAPVRQTGHGFRARAVMVLKSRLRLGR